MTASNDPDPDQDLNDYLAGKHPLSRLYAQRRVPRPLQLDRQILRQARLAARRPWRARWRPLFATAATLVLGVAVGWTVFNTREAEQALQLRSAPRSSQARVAAEPPQLALPPPDIGAMADDAQPRSAKARGQQELPALQPPTAQDRRPKTEADQRKAAPPPERSAPLAQPPPTPATQSEEPAQSAATASSLGGAAQGLVAPGRLAKSPPIVSDDAQINRLIDHVRTLEDGRIRLHGQSLSGAELASIWEQRRRTRSPACAQASDFIRHCALPGYEQAQVSRADGTSQPLAELLPLWMSDARYDSH